ncbi:GTP pyrophosphokinase family protein [Vibrio parahaemolyticus]|uniref:GTP pyrophosphokinase n=1 Tax=Vibrio parahaemolyticus TaxID=670 RepID=UPI001D2A7686|nr:RelA/SpoT domain-containing protein [Vibrio parahaemolyticus]EGR1556858.1 hypothetical protein [Vibrio parahaemolyticus]MCZ5985645.1 RelA/SpoT domain-containing protein [Vibrio parahaemolyticus]
MENNTKQVVEDSYTTHFAEAERFRGSIVQQLTTMINSKSLQLAVPLESRVKDKSSVLEKLERKSKEIKSVLDLTDFVGIRAILLFKKDVETVCNMIQETFEIIESEDTSGRLSYDQFGYQSNHFVVKIPRSWLNVPTMSNFEYFQAEIQVRTMSQHIWATASHKLQYKKSSNVPAPLKRTINRISALLETVDLEFERVLHERDEYISHINLAEDSEVNDNLNIDVFIALLDELMPPKNKWPGQEDYSKLLDEYLLHGIDTKEKVKRIITTMLPRVIKEDSSKVKDELRRESDADILERLNQGVFYKHVGLARRCLHLSFS